MNKTKLLLLSSILLATASFGSKSEIRLLENNTYPFIIKDKKIKKYNFGTNFTKVCSTCSTRKVREVSKIKKNLTTDEFFITEIKKVFKELNESVDLKTSTEIVKK